MGLDTTHDCFHGSYSWFMQWRRALCRAAGLGDLDGHTGFGGTLEWPEHPLTPLLNHSDCDGIISHTVAAGLADALAAICYQLPVEWWHTTQTFAHGLRWAALREEDVEFG